MASSSFTNRIPSYVAIFLIIIFTPNTRATKQFKSIICFGDSLSDTGNLAKIIDPASPFSNFLRLPYGETFFHRPTGRFSDGRVMVDFLAQSLGLPFTRPYIGSNISTGNINEFLQGINFAVGGATALNQEFFDKYGIAIPLPNASLPYQVSWFKNDFLPVVCAKPGGCKDYLKNALILVGEIGGNDYNYALLSYNKTFEEARGFIPYVVGAIGSAVTDLIKLGAATLLVPGNFPIGCNSKYLTVFQTSNRFDYDPTTGCLNRPNELSKEHNKALQLELTRIRIQHPNVTILYVDNYGASMPLYRYPTKYGFSKLGGLYSCCGGSGPYNISLTINCGDPGSRTCPNPALYVCWDGLHFTDAASGWIVKILLRQIFYGIH